MVTPFYSPIVSGSSRLFTDIVEYLHNVGHDIAVLTYGLDDPKKLEEFDASQPYPIYRTYPKGKAGGAGSLQMLLDCYRITKLRNDDLLVSGVAWSMGVTVCLVGRIVRKQVLVYCLGEDVSVVAESRLKQWILRLALLSARQLVAISHFTAKGILALGVSKNRVRVIHPSIDPEPYLNCNPADVEKMRKSFGLEGKKIILTLARLSMRKGHDMIVRTLSELSQTIPNVHYLIVGYGDTNDLMTLAKAEGVEDRITIIPYVATDELPVLHNLPDVYAMVSRLDPIAKEVEGFGIVYLEAAASGKPCVAGSQGGSPDAVCDGVTGFVVDPTSPSEICQALRILLADENKAAVMGQAGRDRVFREFTKTSMLDKVGSLIDEMHLPSDKNSHF